MKIAHLLVLCSVAVTVFAAPQKEVASTYQKWLNEDVTYIITPAERVAFAKLSTDNQRKKFIDEFWLRRDPTPDTLENEFKDEHYRRIAYANEHFGVQVPGWKTDRGRIYVVFGPPDEIEDHSAGEKYDRPQEQGGGTTSAFPFFAWTYRNLEGIGTNVKIEFVDRAGSGEFHLIIDPNHPLGNGN